MYGNFIYFILVLLVYSTYVPPQEPYLGRFEGFALFFVLFAIFSAVTKSAFSKLTREIVMRGPYGLHGSFDRIFTRQAIMALVFFTVYIYGLNLKLLLFDIPVLSSSPTAMAVLFVALFIGHLAIIWFFAYGPYRRLFGAPVSRWAYVRSNISFNLPIILPWFLISLCTDLIALLPFETPKQWLASLAGQVLYFSCFFALFVVVAPSLIKSFWLCRPLPEGPKRQRIESMCRRAGLGYRDILDWPIFEGRLLSAAVMGLVKRFRYILVTNSLLALLNDEEIDAVVAHEIGHIKRKHLFFYLIFFLGFLVLIYSVYDLVLYGIFYGNLALPITQGGAEELTTFTSVLFAAAMAIILLIYFRFIFGFFMRNCERQADLYAFEFIGDSRGLVSSLEKIAVYSGNSHDRPSWHHFSIRQRIDYLKRCESDRRWIVKHDSKLRRSIAAFVVALISVGYFGFTNDFGEMSKTLNSRFLEKVIIKEIATNPTNPALFYILGTIHYQNKSYEEAIDAYEKAVTLAPQHAEALNNLAWIYATCEVTSLRSPVKALIHAQTAAAVNPSPHILDTLAESYYINGLYEKAVSAIEKARSLNPEDRDYYEKQLAKFKTAIKIE